MSREIRYIAQVQSTSLIFGGIFIFTVFLWSFIYIVMDDLNKKSITESKLAVGSRISSLAEQVQVLASDYNNWNTVFIASQNKDLDFISENYGITATRGDVFEYALMYSGPFVDPIAWVKKRGYKPVKSFLSQHQLDAIRNETLNLSIGERETFDFSEVIDGQLVMLSASQLLPEDLSLIKDYDPSRIGTALIGKVLSPEKLNDVGQELGLKNMNVSFSLPAADAPSYVFRSFAGNPAAYLTWDVPEAGSSLLTRMLPILALVNIIFVVGGIFVVRQMHASTEKLIQKEADAAYLARTDSLSGLPNRFALSEHIEKIDQQAEIDVAIIQIDLDRFKQVNDVIGHGGGDKYIQQFSERLSSLQADDTFIARVGGDEFTVVITGLSLGDNTFWLDRAELIAQVFIKPIECDGFSFDISASMGLAARTDPNDSLTKVISRSDKAMYHAKRLKSGGISIYDSKMEALDTHRSAIEKAMRVALKKGHEFYIEYQAIYSCHTQANLVRLEALVRWNSDFLGAVAPSEFIPVAEETGLIVPLGWMIVDLVIIDLVANPSMMVALNISPMQLTSPRFIDELYRRLSASGVSSFRVDLELTENLAISGDDNILSELHKAKQFGFTISLDDFGTGFSSIGYVRMVPFDVVKIDRSYISGDVKQSQNREAVSAVISLVKSLGREVVAEGVETGEQLDWLGSVGCDLVQGFYFGRPQSIDFFAGEFSNNRLFNFRHGVGERNRLLQL